MTECASMCQNVCRVFGYNSVMKKCRTHKKIFTTQMSVESGWRSVTVLPLDCKDLREKGNTNTGVYEIYPFGNSSIPVQVYCDMDTMNGGWTAIQKRLDGSLSFNRIWTDYKNGFGDPAQNVWIGNDVIHQLTKGKNSFLYVSITVHNGTTLYELYDQFSVSDEADKYRLSLAGPATGTLGDSMLNTRQSIYDLSGIYFSTPDRDNDNYFYSCASDFKGGWWFNYCHHAFLNGPWSSVQWTYPWNPTVTSGTSVTGTMMMIKRK
ncbi:fibroleukin-like [Saccostrea echinata]|uniref:fibroleukin-like n=1 Tax=Saccostrea echinata TaxID=191078 RepID=UPI002A8312B2|nr:fibroleukin-like [Saccostrea echinata]